MSSAIVIKNKFDNKDYRISIIPVCKRVSIPNAFRRDPNPNEYVKVAGEINSEPTEFDNIIFEAAIFAKNSFYKPLFTIELDGITNEDAGEKFKKFVCHVIVNEKIDDLMNFQDEFSTDLIKSISSGGTVTFTALELAFYMGFKQVILVGLDHRYNEKGIPNQTEVRRGESDTSHFHPGYFPKGSRWQLPDLRRSEIAYQLALDAYKADHREIIDATENGNCKIFPKVDFNELF